MESPRAALMVRLGILVDGGGDQASGASALLVDALRRGLPTAVWSTEQDAGAALSGSGLQEVLDVVSGADAVGGDEAEVVRGLLATLGVPAERCVVLADDAGSVRTARSIGLHAAGVGTPDAAVATAAAVDLSAYPPLRSERVELDHGVALLDGWSVAVDRHEPGLVGTVGSNLMTGNGALGYRGTAPEWDAGADVACIVAGTYDCADGKWTELVSAPNALRARWWEGQRALQVPHDAPLPDDVVHARRLDLLLGRTVRDVDFPGGIRLTDERFAALDELGLVAQRQRVTAPVGTRLTVRVALDGHVWDLNGPHLPELDLDAPDADPDTVLLARGRTVQSGVEVAVAQAATLRSGRLVATRLERAPRVAERVWEVEVVDDDGVVLDLAMGVAHSREHDDPAAAARGIARRARDAGYAALLTRQVAAWRGVWDATDVEVDGDPVARASLRFGTYHSVIATPRHAPHLPIGARGLSCQAYQGAAFWDQEVFNLPMFLFTQPDVARGLLRYRVGTLDGARRKAARLGYDGAFFAWISGETGDELCPDFFFSDVLTGRPIRNHFNDWQMHVAPDVALAVARYVRVTGDASLLVDGGAELQFEVARFLDSFVWHDHRADTYHCVRLLGPDEYHENVDDNAFTNHQSAAALRAAVATWHRLADDRPDVLRELQGRLGLTDDDRVGWERVADRLHLPRPDRDTLVIEQFRGYHDLEDVRPDDLEDRLLHPAEYWGWPNGVATHTQVLKQADVVQLFVCQPGAFPDDVVAANVDHYLPRTQHGSSLSPGAYALVMARLGRVEPARELFLRSATIDLLSRSEAAPGGTFIGGIRTAAAAMSWQVVVLGFAGLSVTADGVALAPRLPGSWTRLAFGVQVRGVGLQVQVTPDRVEVVSDPQAPQDLAVDLPDGRHLLAPGQRAGSPR